MAQLAHMAGRARDTDEIHAERERVGRNGQAHWQPVGARRVGQQAEALEVLDEWLGGVGVGDVDRGQQDLRALREVVVAFLLRRRQPVAVVRDDRRISTVEFDLHGVVEHTADHRNDVKDGSKQIEASEDREQIEQKANEPHGGFLLGRRVRRDLRPPLVK